MRRSGQEKGKQTRILKSKQRSRQWTERASRLKQGALFNVTGNNGVSPSERHKVTSSVSNHVVNGCKLIECSLPPHFLP